MTSGKSDESGTKCIIKFKNKDICIKVGHSDRCYNCHISRYCRCVYVSINDAISFHKFLEKKNICCVFDSYDTLIENKRLDIYEYFLENSLVDYEYLFCYAFVWSNMDVVKILLDYADPDDIYEALVDYCSKCDIGIIKLFLDKVSNYPIFKERTHEQLLHNIIKEDDPQLLKLCLKYDIDLDRYFDDLLEIALEKGLINIAEYLSRFNYGVSTDPDGYIKYWAKKDRPDMVEFLFKLYEGCFGQEWLDKRLLNSEKYSEEVVQLFIDNGADIEKYGKQLYKKARKNKNFDLARYIKDMLDE